MSEEEGGEDEGDGAGAEVEVGEGGVASPSAPNDALYSESTTEGSTWERRKKKTEDRCGALTSTEGGGGAAAPPGGGSLGHPSGAGGGWRQRTSHWPSMDLRRVMGRTRVMSTSRRWRSDCACGSVEGVKKREWRAAVAEAEQRG